jgi:hypothetical protein
MTSPVFQALVNARLAQSNRDEAAIADDVAGALGAPPPDIHRPERFIRWCEDQGLVWRPANPVVVAKFVLGHTKIGTLLEEIRTLSLAHCETGLADPTVAYQVTQALLKLVKFEAPRSWPDSEKLVFFLLPPDLQKYQVIRERDRDLTLRRKMNEIAEAKKQLLKEITPHVAVEEQPAESHAA